MTSGAEYVRPGDDAPMHPMRSTGVRVPVKGLRAQRKRWAEESKQEEARTVCLSLISVFRLLL